MEAGHAGNRFPRVEGILKVKPTTKTWREIYPSQRCTVRRPKPKAEDFVLSFELKKGERMLAEGAGQLVSPPEDATNLTSAPLWEPEDAPKVLRDDWHWELGPRAEVSLWTTEPVLSIRVTRDLRTVPLYVEVGCEAGREGVTGKITRGMYEPQEPPEINPLGKCDWLLEAHFEEANGSTILRMLSTEEDDETLAPGSSILEYLDALVPQAHS